VLTDLVLTQTDGLSDNVFPAEMITICSFAARSGGSEDEQVQTMADHIVDYARQCMVNHRRVSPFESTSTYSSPLWYLTSTIGDAAREGMFFRGGVSSRFLSQSQLGLTPILVLC
jgi:protein phosphatase PTC7